MVKKAVGAINEMLCAIVLPVKKQKPDKQEIRLCPHCGHSMAKTRMFCSNCQQFKNGHGGPVQDQFHY